MGNEWMAGWMDNENSPWLCSPDVFFIWINVLCGLVLRIWCSHCPVSIPMQGLTGLGSCGLVYKAVVVVIRRSLVQFPALAVHLSTSLWTRYCSLDTASWLPTAPQTWVKCRGLSSLCTCQRFLLLLQHILCSWITEIMSWMNQSFHR